MISALEWIAEGRIARAVAAGELSGLPGEGKPLEFDEDPLVPLERRLVMRVLKNSGCVPEEISMLKELRELEHELGAGEGGAAAEEKLLALRMRLEKAGLGGGAFAQYLPQLRARMQRKA